jgi:hypothetical protein
MDHGSFFSRVRARKKVAALQILLSGLLLVTLSSPSFGSSGPVSLPDFAGFVQVEFSEATGVLMRGQTLPVDFMFTTPIEIDGPVSAELFLQTGPHSLSSKGDYPYAQYVVFESGSKGMLIDENGYTVGGTISIADGVLLTDRGWAGANMTAYSSAGTRIAGVHFELALPNTGEMVFVGRIGLQMNGGTLPVVSQNSFSDDANAVSASISVPLVIPSSPTISDTSDFPTNTQSSTAFNVPNLGSVTLTTNGQGAASAVYGQIHLESGPAPAGFAIVANRQVGFLTSEVAIPAAPVMRSGRVFVEASPDGMVNTAVSFANPNAQIANVQYELRDPLGSILKNGTFSLTGVGSACGAVICNQLSTFINSPPFIANESIQGTLSFTSSVPISASAIRVYQNERTPHESVMTSQPFIDLSLIPARATQVLPHFLVGNGMETHLVLVNPTGTPLRGTLRFYDTWGSPMYMRDDNGSDSLTYSVSPNGVQSFTPDGLLPAEVGSAWIIPNDDSPSPAAFSIVTYKPQQFTVAQATVPVVMGTSFRMYVETSAVPQITTGITIANATDRAGFITLSFTNLNGEFVASGSLYIGARAEYIGSLEGLLPTLSGSSTRGVLRITTNGEDISVAGFRYRMSERQSFPEPIFTSITPTVENDLDNSGERILSEVLNGDGFSTEVVLYSQNAGDTARGHLQFIQQDGSPIDLEIH